MDQRSLSKGATSVVVAIAVLGSACSTAWTPFQASIYNPAQLFSESTEVRGLRVNLLYGENARMDGLDVGCVNLAGEVDGIQVGVLVNGTRGRVRGLQVPSVVNHAGEVLGGQVAAYNFSRGVVGAQIAGGNQTEGGVTGLQAAVLFNEAESLEGMQIGGLHNRSGAVSGAQLAAGVNQAKEMVGVQISALGNEAEGFVGLQIGGLLNRAEGLRGLQIGLLNLNKGGLLPIFPIVNFGLRDGRASHDSGGLVSD
jgi:hypothetical protein